MPEFNVVDDHVHVERRIGRREMHPNASENLRKANLAKASGFAIPGRVPVEVEERHVERSHDMRQTATPLNPSLVHDAEGNSWNGRRSAS